MSTASERPAPRFYAAGFFWDADTRRVLLYSCDAKGRFLGGLSQAGETPAECWSRVVDTELGFGVLPEEATLLRSRLSSRSQRMRHVLWVEKLPDAATLSFGAGADLAWHRLDDLDRHELTPGTREDLHYFCSTLPALERSRN